MSTEGRTDWAARGSLKWAWLVIISVGLLDSIWSGHLGFRFKALPEAALLIAAPLGFGLFFDCYKSNPRCRDFGYCVALWLAFPFVVNSYSYLAATMHFPLCDAQLCGLDRAAGFDWSRWFTLVRSHQTVSTILRIAYSSLFFQIVASVAIFALTGNEDRNRELLWVAMLAALQAVVISGFVPAMGPMAGGTLPPWTTALLQVRDGTMKAVALTSEWGIVAFPSFHAAVALVFIYVHRPPCGSFVPFAALNIIVLLATPFVGHHYGTDMIGGAAIAAVAIAIYRSAVSWARSRGDLNGGFEPVSVVSGAESEPFYQA